MDKIEMQAIQTKDKSEGFAIFMAQSATKALISTIAPSEHLEALLHSAFEFGYGTGAISTTMALIKGIGGPR